MSDTMVEVGVEETYQSEEVPILFLHQIERTYKQGDAALAVGC